jgi:hypothetical protein
MIILRNISRGIQLFFLCCFLCSAVHAQGLQQRKYSLELHLLEPSMLVLNRSISKSGNWSILFGAGFSGYAYNAHIYGRYVKANDNFGSYLDGYIIEAAFRRYISFTEKKRLGILIQSGLFYRQLQWSLRGTEVVDIDHEVFTYVRSGFYYRLSDKIELGSLAGMGIQLNAQAVVTEFMVSAYVGYKLGRVKPK